MHKTAKESLKSEALKLNANAIVGVKIDFDEISGSGKSMFMVSAVGTAVVVDQTMQKDTPKTDGIAGQDLDVKIMQLRYLRAITSETIISDEQWNFLLENPVNEIADTLIPNILYAKTNLVGDFNAYYSKVKTYFTVIDQEYAEELLYSKIVEFPEIVSEIMREAELFSPQHTHELFIKGHSDVAFASLKANKRIYGHDDLDMMRKILSHVTAQSDKKGRVDTKKGGMLSKEKEVFLCYQGHENNIDVDFCKVCGVNIHGYTQEEKEIIDRLTNQIEALSIILE